MKLNARASLDKLYAVRGFYHTRQGRNWTQHTRATRSAARRCDSVSASTRSRKPSTCVKSSLPPSYARRVNSPAAAGRHSGIRARAARTAPTTARPPCTCNSSTSSVVNERGAVLCMARDDDGVGQRIGSFFSGEGSAHRGRRRRGLRRESRRCEGRGCGIAPASMEWVWCWLCLRRPYLGPDALSALSAPFAARR